VLGGGSVYRQRSAAPVGMRRQGCGAPPPPRLCCAVCTWHAAAAARWVMAAQPRRRPPPPRTRSTCGGSGSWRAGRRPAGSGGRRSAGRDGGYAGCWRGGGRARGAPRRLWRRPPRIVDGCRVRWRWRQVAQVVVRWRRRQVSGIVVRWGRRQGRGRQAAGAAGGQDAGKRVGGAGSGAATTAAAAAARARAQPAQITAGCEGVGRLCSSWWWWGWGACGLGSRLDGGGRVVAKRIPARLRGGVGAHQSSANRRPCSPAVNPVRPAWGSCRRLHWRTDCSFRCLLRLLHTAIATAIVNWLTAPVTRARYMNITLVVMQCVTLPGAFGAACHSRCGAAASRTRVNSPAPPTGASHVDPLPLLPSSSSQTCQQAVTPTHRCWHLRTGGPRVG